MNTDPGNGKSVHGNGDPAARVLVVTLGVMIAGVTGCGPQPDLTTQQTRAVAEERDQAVSQLKGLEADVLALKQTQLQLIEEKEAAAEEADGLIAGLMEENHGYRERIERMNARLDEAKADRFADLIRLQDGQEVVCRVLDLYGSVVEVQLPDGSRKKARLNDIQRILLRATSDFEIIPERRSVADMTPQVSPTRSEGDRNLELSPFWNIPLPASTRTTQALQQMLRAYGTPQLDQNGRAGAVLFQTIDYLMPLEAAQQALGQKAVQRDEVAVPGLPKNSFFTYEYSGFFEGRFNRLLLVTDNASQVVAVQLVQDAPQSRWLDPDMPAEYSKIYNSSLNLFNIIENRAKSISKGLVGLKVTRLNEDVIRVDSEFLSSQRNSKECVRLYIAQPVVDLILHLIDTRY